MLGKEKQSLPGYWPTARLVRLWGIAGVDMLLTPLQYLTPDILSHSRNTMCGHGGVNGGRKNMSMSSYGTLSYIAKDVTLL